MYTLNIILRNLLGHTSLSYLVIIVQCKLYDVLMDFLKLHFFTPEKYKFSYTMTVTTVHSTKVLSSSKKKIKILSISC